MPVDAKHSVASLIPRCGESRIEDLIPTEYSLSVGAPEICTVKSGSGMR